MGYKTTGAGIARSQHPTLRIDGKKGFYIGVTNRSGKKRLGEHEGDARKIQPKTLHHAAAKQADEILSIAPIVLPHLKTFVQHFDCHGSELAAGFTAAELQRGWLFAVEGHLAALERSYASSPTYSAILNDFLGRPTDDVIGLNGTNCLPGSGKRIRRPPRNYAVDRRALLDGIQDGGVELALYNIKSKSSKDTSSDQHTVGVKFPLWFFDKGTDSNNTLLTLPREVKEQLGVLPTKGGRVNFRLRRRQGPPPGFMGPIDIARFLAAFESLVGLDDGKEVAVTFSRGNFITKIAHHVLGTVARRIGVYGSLSSPFGDFEPATLESTSPEEFPTHQAMEYTTLLLASSRRTVTRTECAKAGVFWTTRVAAEVVGDVTVPPPEPDEFDEDVELDMVKAVRLADEDGEFDKMLYGYVAQTDLEPLDPPRLKVVPGHYPASVLSAFEGCPAQRGMGPAKIDWLRQRLIPMPTRLQLLRSGQFPVALDGKGKELFPHRSCGQNRTQPPRKLVAKMGDKKRCLVEIDPEADEMWWTDLKGGRRTKNAPKGAKKMAAMDSVREGRQRAQREYI